MMKRYSQVLLLCIVTGNCNTLLSARRPQIKEIQPAIKESEESAPYDDIALWKTLDDDSKEFLTHFGKFVQGWIQMVCGGQQKETDPKMLTDGIHQTIGSFIDMIITGMKKSQIKTIKNEKDAQKIREWIIKKYSKAMHSIVRHEVTKSRQMGLVKI